MKQTGCLIWYLLTLAFVRAQVPDSVVLDAVPPVPESLKANVSPYLEFRAAVFQDWHPTRREILITTRFADTAQLHHVGMPGGARRQLTFGSEPVASASYRPATGDFIVYSQDKGGGEFYQLYRYDPRTGKAHLLTDGKSRNMGLRWAWSGKQFAYTSTRRNGRDNDIWLMDPSQPETNRMISQVEGGGWSIADWSHDEQQLLLVEYLSINKSHLHLLELRTGQRRRLTSDSEQPVSWANARFSSDDKAIFVTTDLNSEFTRLALFDLPPASQSLGAPRRVLTEHIPWDIEQFEISRNGKHLAAIANENGAGVVHLFETNSGQERQLPKLPMGVLSNLTWHDNNRDLGFNVSSARSPADAFSLDIESGQVQRWTESETGGLDASGFIEPELIKLKSFDGLQISAFLYRPDPHKFPNRRPVVINIHGGPESQARPGFLARLNYLLNEMGVAVVVPNVRGSSGYGKTFLTLDNGFKREDSVRDIGAVIDWLRDDARVDPDRIAVIGGSYGGYMVLASMAHYNDRLRCGVDIVGISNFNTFLKNTQDYRRDLRRAEYGDERDPAMNEFLARISPTALVDKIQKPLLVMQGRNDPRVPFTEAEQMVKAIRNAGGKVWYLMATDEGHGFAKKKNSDFAFFVTIKFLEDYLIK